MTQINYFQNKEKLIKELKNLPRKNITLVMADFDDTIFSRDEQLNSHDEFSLLLQKNRGNKGNDIIKDVIGIENMMERYYKNKPFPKDITSKMNPEHDLILTAGYQEIQTAKITATKLENFPLEVVLHGEEKPQRLIEYIISLWFIPEKIEVYEDRTNHFEATKKEFEEITNSKMDIFFVQMYGNDKKIELKKVA